MFVLDYANMFLSFHNRSLNTLFSIDYYPLFCSCYFMVDHWSPYYTFLGKIKTPTLSFFVTEIVFPLPWNNKKPYAKIYINLHETGEGFQKPP